MSHMPILKVSITLDLPVDREYVESVICSAVEGGVNYWALVRDLFDKDGNKVARNRKIPLSEQIPQVLYQGGSVEFLDNEDDNDVFLLTLGKFSNGLQQFLRSGHYKESMTELLDAANIDANYADVIIQYALFGTVVYG